MISLPSGDNFAADIGYVVLPTDIDRNQYIANSLRTCTVSLQGNDGAFYNRIPLSEIDMGFIEFPDKVGQLGSSILIINNPTNNHFIGATLLRNPSDIQDLQENQFKFKRRWKDGYVEITGSGKDKYVGISVNSDTTGGVFYVNVKNKQKNAKIQLQVQGDIITTSKNNKIQTSESQELSTVSSANEEEIALIKQTSDKNFLSAKTNHLEGDKIQHNEGKEPMLLGTTTAKKIVSILEAILKLTVPTALGPSGVPINSPEFQKIIQGIDEIKSELSFLD